MAQGWTAIEEALQANDRRYTVFVGHKHNYAKFVRNGREYFMLATTGGGSKMRGVEFGEFDHVAWVTMKPNGPIVANVLLDGVQPDDVRKADEYQQAQRLNRRRKCHSCRTIDSRRRRCPRRQVCSRTGGGLASGKMTNDPMISAFDEPKRTIAVV